MNLKNLKFDLPKTWKEASRMGSENQVVIRVYHTNPLAHIDPKRLQDQVMPSADPDVSITKIGIPTPGARPLDDFKKGMEAAIGSGLMPPEWTPQKLNKLWEGMTKTPHGERPGESDLANDIEIIQCQDEEFARQTLKNKGQMPTQGFNVPIPGGVSIPGMPKNMTMSDLFQSDMLKKFIPKEQLGRLKKMQSAIREVQVKMPQVKQDLEKRGVKYGEGKYLGCEAIYFESPNHNPPPTPRSSSRGASTGEGGGGGGCTELDPLPKVTRPYSATNTFYLGLLVKNFIVGGQLLTAIDSMPPGNMPCYSLSETKEVLTTDRVEGKIFKGIVIVPLVSNFAREGYFYKEEVEEIYRDIISKLK